MTQTNIIRWFPALIYTVDKEDKYSVLKLITKIFIFNLLLAILATLVLGTGEEAAFFKESEIGGEAAILNLLVFLFLVILTSIGIYLLIRLKKFSLLEIISTFLFAFISGSVASLIIPLWLYFLVIQFAIITQMEFILIEFLYIFDIVVLFIFALFFILQLLALVHIRFLKFRNTILLVTASWAGVFLGLYSGILTPPILMLGFSLYDLYAVYKGPIKMITSELHELDFARKSEKEGVFVLGLGDLFFYSLALSYSLAYLGISAFILVTIALILGLLITIFILLSRSKSEGSQEVPALPIPLFLALLAIVLSNFII
ncbi:MAG: hypothetical protein DRZ80_04185 [Thermoprotei archaeon]|nr:MAG: hypothetical protein DRZ80_04185 [Thermoprotei archaeon]